MDSLKPLPSVALVTRHEQQRLLDRIRAVRESRPEDAWQAKSLRTTTSDSPQPTPETVK